MRGEDAVSFCDTSAVGERCFASGLSSTEGCHYFAVLGTRCGAVAVIFITFARTCACYGGVPNDSTYLFAHAHLRSVSLGESISGDIFSGP